MPKKAEIEAGAAVVNNLRFPGQYEDQETGLHDNWHRYYYSRTGRYFTQDPIGLDGAPNLFTYVDNNPINTIDPLGLFAEINCTRCPDGSLSCNITEDGVKSISFETNTGRNDIAIEPLKDPHGKNGPLPLGKYDLINSYSHKFKRELPSPTNTGIPGEVVTPKGTKRTGVRVHRGNFSQGCLTTGKGEQGKLIEELIRELVNSHSDKGGTIITINEGDCCENENKK